VERLEDAPGRGAASQILEKPMFICGAGVREDVYILVHSAHLSLSLSQENDFLLASVL
jgi:hypothetical protein